MKHVQYGFNHLVGTAMYQSGYLKVEVSPLPKAGPVDDAWLEMFVTMLGNAVFESFLVHTRALIEFFVPPPRRWPEDIGAEHYFATPTVWTDGLDAGDLPQVRDRISKKLAHLSYHRIADTNSFNPRAIILGLTSLRDRFNAMRPQYLIDADVESLDERPRQPE